MSAATSIVSSDSQGPDGAWRHNGSVPVPLPDSPLHRSLCRLFRVRQFNDIHARSAELGLPFPHGNKRRERLDRIRRAGVLFVHVPKNGGTSICQQLYGGIMMHETARYYHRVAPDLCKGLPSFAIWRDPVERFVSAWAFARRGGTKQVQIHAAFNDLYRSFQTLDDVIAHIETRRSLYEMDHIFRPQSWYVCDRQGKLLVDQLFSMAQISRLPELVPALRGKNIPRLNRNDYTHQITERQAERIRSLYAQDEALKPL